MTAQTVSKWTSGGWLAVCEHSRLPLERGVAAMVDGVQVAVFRLDDGTVRAVQNLDPFSGAMVLSRGIVGCRGGRPVVASPMYKQAFDLENGECLDDPSVRLEVLAVLVQDGIVHVWADSAQRSR